MRVSFLGIILLAVLAVLIIFGVAAALGSFKRIRLGHPTLTCPHCGQETAENRGVCEKCGQSL